MLQAIQEIEAVSAAGAALVRALTNRERPRIVLTDPEILDDYLLTLTKLRRLERRLRRNLDK